MQHMDERRRESASGGESFGGEAGKCLVEATAFLMNIKLCCSMLSSRERTQLSQAQCDKNSSPETRNSRFSARRLRFYCAVLALFIITEFFIPRLLRPPCDGGFSTSSSSLSATSREEAPEIKRYMENIKSRLKVSESFEL